MWCTRWFLPLLLLPLPTAPPFFLIVFIFSMTLHAKPCFYCIVLLTSLFVSSCYWHPFPISNPLSNPWSPNITTFADALHASISLTNTHTEIESGIKSPTVMRAVDRCWCDFSAGDVFEPFNVTKWEFTSVERLKEELVKQRRSQDMQSKNGSVEAEVVDSVASPSPVGWLWSTLAPLYRRSRSYDRSHTPEPRPPGSSEESKLGWIRREYDLRPQGLGIIVDFGWTRTRTS